MRTIAAVVAGFLAACVAAWCGSVVVLLTARGMPLGSAGGPARAGELGALVLIGFGAALGGALLARRMAVPGGVGAPLAVGALLALGAAVGFTRAGSQWPRWFVVALALACLAGAALAARQRS